MHIGSLQVGDRWFFGDVSVRQNGAEVQLRSLRLKEGYHLRHPHFQKLASEFETAFHGFGGGSERQTTVKGLFANQAKITNNLDLFYMAVHGKHGSVRSKAKVPVEHQLPPSFSPLYLLFRQICMELETETSNSIIPPIPSRTCTMKMTICEKFGLDPNVVSMIDIRKLYTSATNLIYAKMEEEEKLSADGRAARMSNHTPASHKSYYETTKIGWEARWYDWYHGFFGETIHGSDFGFSFAQEPVSTEAQTNALQTLFGQLATFNSTDQKRMVDLSCNSHDMHKFFGLPCGVGKTLSVLIPIVNEKLTKRFSGCRVFIVPYSFLKDSLFADWFYLCVDQLRMEHVLTLM